MRAFVYVGAGLWIIVGVFIFVRYMILSAQMMNNRVPKAGGTSPLQFTSTDPADYTERGRRYLQKTIRAWLVIFAYLPTLFIVIYIAMSL